MSTKELLIDNHASDALESRRIPDPYSFEITSKGDILYPPTQEDIEKYIRTDHPVYLREKSAVKVIKERLKTKEADFFVWITPPYPEIYPVLKIVTSKIIEKEPRKLLFNRALVVDVNDPGIILQTANTLAQFDTRKVVYTDLEQIRSRPICTNFENEDRVFEILNNLKNLGRQIDLIKSGEDIKIKKEVRDQIAQIIDVDNLEKEMTNRQILGKYERSCPIRNSGGQSAFALFFGNSLNSENSFPCPKCERPIPSKLGIEVCPYAGCDAKKSDSRSLCD